MLACNWLPNYKTIRRDKSANLITWSFWLKQRVLKGVFTLAAQSRPP